MNNIDIVSNINRKFLDNKNYFQSLISEAYKLQLLNDDDILNIQIQLLELLDKSVYKYNGLDSSSIKQEILEEISISNIYTIGVYLKSFANPDAAVETVKNKKLIYVYENGKKQIYKMLDIIRVMYFKVKQNLVDIDNDIYNDTISDGIKGFLKKYNPDFKSQDTIITADYPLYNNLIGKLDGVEFIKQYLNSIYLENSFCNRFAVKNIRYLLYSLSPNYKELIINIFETVFLEVIACKLANKDIYSLAISESDLDKIYKVFNNKTELEIDEFLENTYIEIENELVSQNKELQEYIQKNFNYIKDIIKNSLTCHTLEKIFIPVKVIY